MCGCHSVPSFANAAYAFGELQRRDHEVALADRREDVVARVPACCASVCLLRSCSSRRRTPDFHVGIGHAARRLVELEAGRRAEAELARLRSGCPRPRLVSPVFQTFQNSLPTV